MAALRSHVAGTPTTRDPELAKYVLICKECKAKISDASFIVCKGESRFICTDPDLLDRVNVAARRVKDFTYEMEEGVCAQFLVK